MVPKFLKKTNLDSFQRWKDHDLLTLNLDRWMIFIQPLDDPHPTIIVNPADELTIDMI